MTEAEWRAATDPSAMLEFVRATASDRKLKLFACHCCRAVWDRLRDPHTRAAVELAERAVDGLDTGTRAYRRVHEAAAVATYRHPQRDRWAWIAAHLAVYALDSNLAAHHMLFAALAQMASNRRLRALQVELLRDLFGDHFRSARFCSEWRTATAVALARAMDAARDFSALPILADALQDAGCEDEGVLNHCRREGPHVRGCRVVDGVLGNG